MSERTAKAARKVAGPPKPKQFFKPYMAPVRNEKGEAVDTYIPRRQRRMILRAYMKAIRKGTIQLEEN